MDRGQILFKKLKPHIKQEDFILDYCCGLSQIAEYLMDYNYIGFDYDPEVINKMQVIFGKEKFELNNYVDISYKPDVLMFFRSSYMDHPSHHLILNIEKMKPRVIFLDTCLKKRQISRDEWFHREKNGLCENYLRLNLFLIKLGYNVIDKGNIGNDHYYYQIWRTSDII